MHFRGKNLPPLRRNVIKNIRLLLIASVLAVSSVTALFTYNSANAAPIYEQKFALAPSGETWDFVATGSEHACGLDSGKLYCWGNNELGQLGNGEVEEFANYDAPQTVVTSGVLAGKTITSVAAGYYQTCAIASGEIFCWGANQ